MGYEYINDLFGKFRKGRKTKYSGLETKAQELMKKILNDEIGYEDFFTGFSGLKNEFNTLCGNVIDENTPLWFNTFSATVFLRWRDWHFLRKTFQENPEKFNTPALLSQYRNH